jgi:hypothetical protein
MTPTASSGPTQYVCTGWSMTGQEPTSGTGTSFQMTVTNDAVLTWIWQQKQHRAEHQRTVCAECVADLHQRG